MAAAFTALALSGPLRAADEVERIDVRAPAGDVDLPAYTRAVLPNGLVVLLAERAEDALVHARLSVRNGSADDPPGKDGIASLTAELLTAGTATRTIDRIAEEVDFVGGTLGATADMDNTIATAEFLDRDVERQLELLADVITRPAFLAAEVARVRELRLVQIDALREDAASFADAQFQAAVFAGTPYGHPARGTYSAVASLTRDDVVAFHRKAYVPNNSVLAIAGSFRAAEMLERVRGVFGEWPRGEVTRADFTAPVISGRRVAIVDAPALTQTQVRIGAVGITRNDPDYLAIQVANVILSGGFSSRLVEEIRVNRSLVYRVKSEFEALRRPGAFVIASATKNETTRELVDAIVAEVGKLRAGPIRDAELTRAKNTVVSRATLQLETAAGVAAMMSTIEMFGLPNDYVETLAARVRGFASADIARVIRTHVPADDVVVLIVAPAANAQEQLAGFGPLEVTGFLD